jgi:hypothetical protein
MLINKHHITQRRMKIYRPVVFGGYWSSPLLFIRVVKLHQASTPATHHD